MNLACGIVFTTALTGAAFAQQGTSERRAHTDLDEVRKVSSLLKSEVLNRANEKIATVSDLVLAPDGKIRYAILGVGGVVGIGTKYTAIPWNRLEVKHPHGKWAVNLDMTRDRLDQAPRLQDEHYRELSDPQWLARAREFFGDKTTAAETHGTAAEGSPAATQQGVLLASKVLDARSRILATRAWATSRISCSTEITARPSRSSGMGVSWESARATCPSPGRSYASATSPTARRSRP